MKIQEYIGTRPNEYCIALINHINQIYNRPPLIKNWGISDKNYSYYTFRDTENYMILVDIRNNKSKDINPINMSELILKLF